MRRLLPGTEILRKIMLRRVAGITPVVLMVPDALVPPTAHRIQPPPILVQPPSGMSGEIGH